MKAPYLELKDELDKAYFRFMNSGWYVLGPELKILKKSGRNFAVRNIVLELPTGWIRSAWDWKPAE